MYRSRLARIEEKKNLRKAFIVSMGTLLLLVGAAVLGIPVLSRMAGFFGDIRSSSQPIESLDNIPPVSPRINLPYDATNSAVQTISGFAESGASVYLTHNSDSIGNVVTSENGSFQFSNIQLNEGENIFSAVAIDQAGNKSLESSEVRIKLVNKEPNLELESPTNHQQITEKNVVDIKGQTDLGVRLSVNERTIIVNSSGRFSTTYSLNDGDNTLVFIATDRAGNQARKELVVTYTPQ